MGGGFAYSDDTSSTAVKPPGHPLVNKCFFKGNTGGAYFQSDDGAKIKNCVFVDNTSFGSSGIEVSYSKVKISNCTFYNNDPGKSIDDNPTAVIDCWASNFPEHVILENSIVTWGVQGAPVSWGSGCVIDVSYCNIFGNKEGDWVGELSGMLGNNGNISEDPKFKDKAADDFSLSDDSPCKDKGNPDSPKDPDDTRADMGAFL